MEIKIFKYLKATSNHRNKKVIEKSWKCNTIIKSEIDKIQERLKIYTNVKSHIMQINKMVKGYDICGNKYYHKKLQNNLGKLIQLENVSQGH